MLNKHKHARRHVLAELEDSKIQVEVRKQEKQIDVLARVNEKYVLLIEDKTFSGRHDKQLYRYRDSVLNGETEFTVDCRNDLFSIYLKTGTHTFAERHKIDEDSELGYKVYDRPDFLEVLDTYHGNNSIVIDFRNHLWQLESKSQSFLNWTVATEKNDPQSWAGFYRALEKKFWGPTSLTIWHDLFRDVPGWGSWNSRREDLVFWWRPSELNIEQRVYLQLQREHETEELYLMVNAETKHEENEKVKEYPPARKKEWKECRNRWRVTLFDEWYNLLSEDKNRVKPPKTSRRTTHNLKVGRYNGTYLQYGNDGKLDMRATVSELKKAEKVLLDAVNKKAHTFV